MLLTEVLFAGVLPSALVGETVLAVSGLLEEKEKTPPELETPEEERELPFSGALFQPQRFWYPSSLIGWTGGHRHLDVWLLPMHRFAAAIKRSL